jgi:hypothetical protein
MYSAKTTRRPIRSPSAPAGARTVSEYPWCAAVCGSFLVPLRPLTDLVLEGIEMGSGMASGGKRKTTMAKRNRERRLLERRQEKLAKKAARKQAAADARATQD